MSGEVSVNTAGLPSVPTSRSVAYQAPAAPASAAPASSPASNPASTPAPGAGAQTPFLNPQLTIDPALGITVIEFLSSSGAVENSIPSQHQLEAYRQAQAGQASPPTAASTGANPAPAADTAKG